LSTNLEVNHHYVIQLIQYFFLNYPDYQGFSYWIGQILFQSKAKTEPLYLGKKTQIEQKEKSPFYRNQIKLLQFKEIMNNIKISTRNDDESQTKIGILKVLVETMYLKDMVHDKIFELFELMKDEIPESFSKAHIEYLNKENSILDTHRFFLIYVTILEITQARKPKENKQVKIQNIPISTLPQNQSKSVLDFPPTGGKDSPQNKFMSRLIPDVVVKIICS